MTFARTGQQDAEEATAPRPRPTWRSGGKGSMSRRVLLYRVLLLIGLIIVWEGPVRLGWIESFWISSPSEILARAIRLVQDLEFYGDVWTTIYELLLGLAIGAIGGSVTAFLLSKVPTLQKALDPFLMMLYALPRIALAPLFILWLGIGVTSKVLLVASVVYFVMLLNTHSAIQSVDPELIKAVRTTGASDAFVTRHVRLPSSVPWLLSGIRVSAGMGLPAAIVAEMLGSSAGVGHQIAKASGSYDTTGVFTYLIVLALMALALDVLFKVIESRLLAWRSANETIDS